MKCTLISYLLIYFAISYVRSSIVRIDPLVLIEQGLIRGQKAKDGSYSTFLGVPYAQVDLDDPFGPAQQHTGFNDEIFNANDDSIRCPQTIITPFLPSRDTNNEQESLDCLRLNIYVPNEATSKNLLPVLVWIHGGAFAFGYAGEHGVDHLVKHGIILVTINYRLGPYGFMCLDVPSVPGNQGLKDQYAALRWIRNNIASFGGNPYNVTIAGQSAGAASVLLHLYSKKEKLYNQVIVESGTPQNDGMFVNADITAAVKLATHLGFNTNDTEQALSFLSKTSPGLVTAAAKDLALVLRPCKEKSFDGIEIFIESDPFSLSNENKIKNTPILIGHTSKEHINALSMYEDNYFKNPFYYKLNFSFNMDDDQLKDASEMVRHFYIGDDAITTDVLSEIEEFDSDFVFNHPMKRTITRLINENANPLYQYLFGYVGNSGAVGAAHSEELKYLFEMGNDYLEPNEADQLIIDRMTTLWSNFVKYGNPTPSITDIIPVIWEAATANTRPYLRIDSDMRMESRVFKERMAFWDLFYVIYGEYNNCEK